MVSREIAGKRSKRFFNIPTSCRWSRFLAYGATVLLKVWQLVPGSVRIRAYQSLIRIVARIHGPTGTFDVQRLALGMFIRVSNIYFREGAANGYAALKLAIQKY